MLGYCAPTLSSAKSLAKLPKALEMAQKSTRVSFMTQQRQGRQASNDNADIEEYTALTKKEKRSKPIK